MVLAHQDGRVVGVEHERALVRALLADPDVVRDRGAVVRAADPLVAGAEAARNSASRNASLMPCARVI